jgi:hypothetical protein
MKRRMEVPITTLTTIPPSKDRLQTGDLFNPLGDVPQFKGNKEISQ